MRELENKMYTKDEVESLIQEAILKTEQETIFKTRMEEINKQIIKLEYDAKRAEEEMKSFYLNPERFKAELRA